MKNNRVISIVGTTASGKSDLALNLASKYKLPILNSDSKLLYKEFNIGTAKPSKEDLKKVKHYMVDVLNHKEKSNLKWFLDQSRKIISDINKSNSVPLIVGGTGQYTWGIIEGWDPPEIKPNEELREIIQNEILEIGISSVVEKYSKKFDLLGISDLENPRRLIRAIERLESGYSGNSKNKLNDHKLEALILGIRIDRKTNDKLIQLRIKKMLNSGWIDEVKTLLKLGIKVDSPPMLSIGYREVNEFINNKINETQLEEKIFFSTRKLMRHQDNWFKKSDKRIKWIDFENSYIEADNIISEWLSKREDV
jgi:tRNA dimethylallyltransferase